MTRQDHPTVLAVIVTHNSQSTLPPLLEDLYALPPTVLSHLTIVDSGSDDASYLDSLPPDVTVRKTTNVGFGAACNIGADGVESDYLFFVNPDVRLVQPTILGELVDLAEQHQIDVIGPILLDSDGPYASFGDSAKPPWRRTPKPPFPAADGLLDVGTISGACMLVKTSTFLDLGGFDPRFFMYSEETDLHLRVRMHGGRVSVATGLSVFHARGTGSEGASDRWRTVQRSVAQTLYMQKHYGWSSGTAAILLTLTRWLFRPAFKPRLLSAREYASGLNDGLRRRISD